MTTEAIQLTALRKTFGALTAVDGIDLTVHRGEVLALLGPNGAGKSTTIDLTLGLSHPTAGTARLFGGEPRAAIVDGRVGAMLQGGALLPDTTVLQSITLIAAAHRNPLPVEEAMRRAGVTDIAKQRVNKLSGGQLQRARFAVAVVSNPELLILDEPTAAMDVESRHEFWRSMREFTEQGRTVVFATHYLDEADDFADRIVIMNGGRIAADGTPAEVKAVVAGRTIRFTAVDYDGSLDALPGVHGVLRQGSSYEVRCDDPDAVLRALVTTVPGAHDIEVVSHTMDDAFLALTRATELTTGA